VYHDFFLTLWIGELFYTFALAPTKLAFLALYWRIFKVSSIKRPIKILAATVICWSIVRACISSATVQLRTSGLMLLQIVVNLCHCTPIQSYWDKSIPGKCPINDQKYFVGSVLAHLLMDFAILALPVPYITSLQINFYQKFCVFAMFLLGGL
jgi:hypothetical protein